MATPALNAEQAALLKKTYATKEDFMASSGYAKLTENAKQIALSAYTPTATPTTQSANTDPMLLQQQLNNGTTPTATPWATATPTSTTPPANTNFNQNTGTVPWVKLETPTETKTQTPDYQDTSSQRMSEIVSNLDTYFNSNPNAFLNEANFKTAFDVGNWKRNAAQDQLIMDWYKWKKTDLDKLNAQTLRYNELLSMSEQDLMGLDDPTDLTLINQDPNLRAKYEAAKKNKEILEFVYGKDYGKEPEPRIDGLDGLPDNINAEISTAKVTYEWYKTKMDELQDQMENTYTDLVKEHEGKWVTDQYLRAKANKLNSEIQKEYNDVARQANNEINKYNALVAESQAYLAEEQAKKDDITQRMQLYWMIYWDYSDRNQAQAWVEVQTKDFWTSKNPKWMQSLDWGKTRKPIEWITWVWAWAWGGGWAWGGWVAGGWAWWITATDLLNDPDLSKSVWLASYANLLRWTPQYDFKQKVDSYINNMVLPKLKYLKWPTSDKDIEFIRSAATSLNVWMRESTFKQTLQNMWAVLAKYDSNWNPVVSWPTPTIIQTLNYVNSSYWLDFWSIFNQ